MQDLLSLVIVEDEEDSIQLLSNLVRDYCPEFNLVGIAKNVKDAVGLINDTRPSVLMLDVTLGNESCFDVLKQISNFDFHLVFTTAYAEYALDAFQYNAVYYLLKPYSISEIRKAVAKVMDNETLKKTKKNTNKYIKIHTNEGSETIKTDHIIYVHAAGAYSTIHTTVKTYIISKSLKELETDIDSSTFIRSHHSYLVNTNYIAKLKKADNAEYITLSSGEDLPISRRKKDEVMRIIKVGN
jgi:two-component system, LytTR family, response regulator